MKDVFCVGALLLVPRIAAAADVGTTQQPQQPQQFEWREREGTKEA